MNTYMLAVFVGLHIPVGYIVSVFIVLVTLGYYLSYYLGKRNK